MFHIYVNRISINIKYEKYPRFKRLTHKDALISRSLRWQRIPIRGLPSFYLKKTILVALYIKGALKEIPPTPTVHVWNTKKAAYQTERKMNKERTQRYRSIAPDWLKPTNSELNISGIISLLTKITVLPMTVRNQVKIRIKSYILEVCWTWQMTFSTCQFLDLFTHIKYITYTTPPLLLD